MNQPFFITGLPRSGTAWLANLFTTSKSICYHEPVKAVEMLLARNPGRRVGVSDSTLLQRMSGTIDAWPFARCLYVRRNPDQVLQSLMQIAFGQTPLEETFFRKRIEENLDSASLFIRDPRCAVIEFEQMTNIEVARQAWKWLLPEVRFDEERFEILRGLNVQQNFDHAVAARHAAIRKETL